MRVLVETEFYVGNMMPSQRLRVVYTMYDEPLAVELGHKDAAGGWSWNEVIGGQVDKLSREGLLDYAFQYFARAKDAAP